MMTVRGRKKGVSVLRRQGRGGCPIGEAGPRTENLEFEERGKKVVDAYHVSAEKAQGR